MNSQDGEQYDHDIYPDYTTVSKANIYDMCRAQRKGCCRLTSNADSMKDEEPRPSPAFR